MFFIFLPKSRLIYLKIFRWRQVIDNFVNLYQLSQPSWEKPNQAVKMSFLTLDLSRGCN